MASGFAAENICFNTTVLGIFDNPSRLSPRLMLAPLNFTSTGLIMPLEPILKVPMRRRGGREMRVLFASNEVRALVCGGPAAVQADFPDYHASVLIDSFIGGNRISASLAGGSSSAEFKRLKDVDEVWSIAFRQVKKKQWRVLGRFSKKDHFVGLAIYHREDLSRGGFTKKGEELVTRWNRIFRSAEPVRSNKLSDYMTNVRDLNDPF